MVMSCGKNEWNCPELDRIFSKEISRQETSTLCKAAAASRPSRDIWARSNPQRNADGLRSLLDLDLLHATRDITLATGHETSLLDPDLMHATRDTTVRHRTLDITVRPWSSTHDASHC